MRTQSLLFALAMFLAAQGWEAGCQMLPEPNRELPSAYVPGRELTVTLSAWGDFLHAEVYETVPAAWSVEKSDPAVSDVDPLTGTLHWRLDQPDGWWGIPWDVAITYIVRAPPEQAGEVFFSGYWDYAIHEGGPWSRADTSGDASLSMGLGVLRRVPEDFATIQAAVDASLFGDTVLVSGEGSPYVEDLDLKDGVDLVGAASPSPPELKGFGAAICTARYTDVRGFRISSGLSGVYVPHEGARISDCIITGTTVTAIDFCLSGTGEVSNCTIVGNTCGVYAPSHNPGAVVTDCIFRDNGPSTHSEFPDVDVYGAHVTFSCLEDEICMGSGENNVYADPLFVNPAAGDYRLSPGSPCIDAGDNGACLPGEKDIAGNDRILYGGKGLTVDMGAYEFWLVEANVQQQSPVHPALVWASSSGRTYTVSFSPDLVAWETVAEGVPSAGLTTTWLDGSGRPTSLRTGFYRVSLDN